VPDRRSIFRLFALAGFLLTVALALWLAELRPLVVVVVMAIALLVAWTVEWLSWRQDVARLAVASVDVRDGEAALPLMPPPLAAPDPEPARAEPEVAPEVVAEHLELDEEPEVAPPEPVAEPEPEPESQPEPEPGPAPPQPALRPVPAPPAPPAQPARRPQPARPAAASRDVIDLRTRVTAQPRRWNLWDLERRARDEAQRDPLRYEEWSFLFVHLRQFASPDGSLPTEFDGLVRESFGELLEHAS
jgi:outer membrane biosynthesis protein TonB